MYISYFYVHFAILNKPGSDDLHMSNRFQLELDGNRVEVVGKSSAIPYNAPLTIRNRFTGEFLHTNREFLDNEFEQQVTACNFTSINNRWIFEPVNPALYPAAKAYKPTLDESDRNIRYLGHGDYIRVYHINTANYLLCNNFPSPLDPNAFRINTISKNSSALYEQTVFKISRSDGIDGEKLFSKSSLLKIYSPMYKINVHSKGIVLRWAINQSQVDGNMDTDENKGNRWFVDEIDHPRIINGY